MMMRRIYHVVGQAARASRLAERRDARGAVAAERRGVRARPRERRALVVDAIVACARLAVVVVVVLQRGAAEESERA